MVINGVVFVSIGSFLFGLLIMFIILHFKNKKKNFKYSPILEAVVNDYIKTGEIKSKEFGLLFRDMCQMANYMGIYKQDIYRMMLEAQENGRLKFMDAEYTEKTKEDLFKEEFKQNNYPYEILETDTKIKDLKNKGSKK